MDWIYVTAEDLCELHDLTVVHIQQIMQVKSGKLQKLLAQSLQKIVPSVGNIYLASVLLRENAYFRYRMCRSRLLI